MVEQNDGKLNRLQQDLPEGLLVDAAWLRRKGYATNLVSHYVSTGRLEQPARSVYRKPRGALSWQQAVLSLQTILYTTPQIVGGRTALELQGFAHFLSHIDKEVHLYGPKKPPNWLHKLPLQVKFIHHNSRKLFKTEPALSEGPPQEVNAIESPYSSSVLFDSSLRTQPWGQWDWPLTLSMPERALLELLDELPAHETFDQVDKLMQGLSNLSPRRLQKLLEECRSIKVKRLFFFFADRHHHAWLPRIEKERIDLGTGKRMLVKGGVLDQAYQITIPKDLNGIQ